jgi:hypothetical protein
MADMARHSPVLDVRIRVESDAGRWVVWMDAVTIPDREDYVITHRLGDYATREHAEIAARWMQRSAEKC